MEHNELPAPEAPCARFGPEDPTHYGLRPGYALRAFMGEYLVIPVSPGVGTDSKMAVLSPVAEFIWSKLAASPCTVAELARAVTDEFEVTDEVAVPDICEFLTELEHHHFLTNGG